MLAMLGFEETAFIRSLRTVDPISSFRTTFAYTNITHLLASRIVADAAGASGWNDVLQGALLDPLGMKDSTWTVEAIEGAANHVNGHRWTLEGTVEVPFTPIFPYHLAGAGNINSNIEDMARWVRLQLANGSFEGQQIVTPENLAVTRMARVALSDRLTYAMGWYNFETANGNIVWHDGDALSFGSFRRPRAEPKRRRHHPDQRNQCRLSLGAWNVDSRPGARQPGRRLRCHQDRRDEGVFCSGCRPFRAAG